MFSNVANKLINYSGVGYVQTSDNKYVQYRLMSNSFNTTIANWQGVDDEPTADSENLVKSGGVFNSLQNSGLITSTPTIINLSGNGSKYYAYPFKAGKNYKLSYLPASSVRLEVVFTSTDNSSSPTKINEFPDITLVANELQEVNFVASGNANYFHYWASNTSTVNIQLTITEYNTINLNEYISNVEDKEEESNLLRGLKSYKFDNGGYVKNDGVIVTLPDTSLYAYAKIPCQNGDAVRCHTFNYITTFAIAFFDLNNTFLSGVGAENRGRDVVAIAPQNSAFVYITTDTTMITNPWYSINDASEFIPIDKRSYSERCFFYGKKAPKKACININMDVLSNFSFTSKNINDYIDILKQYGIDSTTFFCRANNSQIGNPIDYAGATKLGYEIAIHSVAEDNFGANDSTPHPTTAEAAGLIQDYQDYFFTNGFGYGLGWVTSRGELYMPLFDTVKSYLAYGHTLANIDARTIDVTSPEAVDNVINKRNGDKMKIVRVGIENLLADGSTEETAIINNVKALIDATIEENGYLCLYHHGYDALTSAYTCRSSVLIPILQYIKQKLDNYDLIVGNECDIVNYFYD